MVDRYKTIEKIVFNNFLQTDIAIYVKNKNGDKQILRKGKLLNFNTKVPFMYFKLVIKDKIREFPLPHPFAISTKDGVVLSYEIKDICADEKMVDRMIRLGDNSDSKIFNQRVYIEKI
jgi:hypothetical protein|tara:strand:- start:803 stop:1156 length:354 start_codon:yes stop_codon:yes gene_type:complete